MVYSIQSEIRYVNDLDLYNLYFTRCPTFESLPNTCRLLADPNDACCVVPDCNSYPTHGPRPTGPGGVPLGGPTSPLPIVVPTPVQQSFTGGRPSGGGINPQTGGITGNNSTYNVSLNNVCRKLKYFCGYGKVFCWYMNSLFSQIMWSHDIFVSGSFLPFSNSDCRRNLTPTENVFFPTDTNHLFVYGHQLSTKCLFVFFFKNHNRVKIVLWRWQTMTFSPILNCDISHKVWSYIDFQSVSQKVKVTIIKIEFSWPGS